MTRRLFLTRSAALAALSPLARATTPSADLRTRSFTLSDAVFPDPERGFHAPVDPASPGPVAQARARGVTLSLVEFDLREFKSAPLSPAKLAELEDFLKLAREQGQKVILRPAYSFTDQDAKCDPADLKLITTHVRQIGEVLQGHAPVLYSVQAGLLGPRGDWRLSTAGDPPPLAARRTVLDAWWTALPATVPVSVPRPCFVRDLAPGAPLTERTAFGGTKPARLGWYHDDLGSDAGEAAAFGPPGWGRDRELSWAGQHNRFVPFGGTVGLGAVGVPAADILRELRSLRAVHLNGWYPAKVLDAWATETIDGAPALPLIQRSLGHRLAARRLACGASVAPGSALAVDLELVNTGFTAPLLPRNVALVLVGADRAHRVTLQGVDPRKWEPGARPIRIQLNLPVPADLTPGPWKLALHLGDPSPELRGDGRYALRLANTDVTFSETTGYNVLAEDIRVG